MNIEEKIFKDLKLAVERKDNHEVDQLRKILHLISDHKARTYPRVPGDVEISAMLSENQNNPSLSNVVSKYIIPDAEKELAKQFADKIYYAIKGIYPLEDFLDKVKEFALKKRNLELN